MLGVWLGVLLAGAVIAGPVSLGLRASSSAFRHTATALPGEEFQSASLEPLLRLRRTTDRSLFWFGARRRFERDTGRDASALAGDARSTADHASAQLARAWPSGPRIDAEASYLRSRDALDADQRTLTLQSPVTEWNGTGSLRSHWLEGMFRSRGAAYDAVTLDDARALTWRGRFVPLHTARSAAFVGWQSHELTQGRATALMDRVIAVGLRHDLSTGLAAELEAGGSEVRFANGERRRGAEAALDLHTLATGTTATSARLQVERAFPATLELRTSHRIADGRAWLSARSLVDAEGGFYRTPTLVRQFAIGLEDTLARATVLGLELGRAEVRPFHSPEARADILQASAWLVRRMRPWLTASAGTSWRRQTGSRLDRDASFERFRVDAALTVLSP